MRDQIHNQTHKPTNIHNLPREEEKDNRIS